MAKTTHAAEYKKDKIKVLLDLIKKYNIIGIINLQNLPSSQYQAMRRQLRGKVELFMTKRRLMNIALEQVKDVKGIELVKQSLQGMPALLFTKENPFSIYKTIKKNKSPAGAKAGQVSPRDVVIPAGPTPFAPGPVIGELSQLGIKAGVQEGKIVVKEDKLAVKEGEVFTAPMASMLTRLGIYPMEIGLDLTAVFEKGILYPKSVLDVDEKEFEKKLVTAVQHATNLAVETAYPAKQTINLMLQKAFRNAKELAVSQGILAKEVIEDMLSKAQSQMSSLKALIKE